MRRYLVGAALTAITFATPAAAATEIFYEDFESVEDSNGDTIGTTGTGFTNVTTAGPWRAGSAANKKIELQFGNVAGAPATPPTGDGGRVFVELDTNANNSMFYTLQQSGDFTLEFLYSPRPRVGSLSNIIEVVVNGVLLGSLGGPAMGTNSSTAWTQQSFSFRAFAGQNIELRAAGTSDSLGGYIDNTRLTLISAVPEPATWLMMILGLGVIGGAMRRRPKQTVSVNYA